MSTIEDFESAPIGATATHQTTGNRAMKISHPERLWFTANRTYFNDEQMRLCGYTLDSVETGPVSAREALNLAWELAHEVKEGQIIPAGTRFLEFSNSKLKEYVAQANIEISPNFASVRTLDPLPDPEPDWLDAPAVMARVEGWVSCHDPQVFTRENKTGTQWVLDTKVYRWDELIDVVPLYPKGQDS